MLIVEDGSAVPNANSYVDIDFIRQYCELRRIALPADDADIVPLAIDAMDYIESLSYQGDRTFAGQYLSFPRIGVVVDEGEYSATAIPRRLQEAQARLVGYRSKGIDLAPSGNAEAQIKRDKVGPIDTEYFELTAANSGPQIPLADALLGPLLRGQGGFGISTVRV